MVLADELAPMPKSRARVWFWRLFKIAMVIAFLFVVGVAILSRIGGSNDSLRQGLEAMIGRTAGDHPARVGRLHGVYFFPYIRVYAQHIMVFRGGEDENATDVLLSMDSLMFSRGFWDSFLWKNRVEGVAVLGLNAAPGYILPLALQNVDIATAEDAFDGDKPGVIVTGAYGPHDFTLQAALRMAQVNMRPVYSLQPGGTDFVLALAGMTVRGTVSRGARGGLQAKISDLSFSADAAFSALLPVTGAVEIMRSGTETTINVTLETAQGRIVWAGDGEDTARAALPQNADVILQDFAARLEDVAGIAP